MTWLIEISGFTDLVGIEKQAFEEEMSKKVRAFAADMINLKNHVTAVQVTTDKKVDRLI